MSFETMHEAFSTFGKAVGIDRLEPDANGNIKLVVNGALQVYFQEVSDVEIEVQAYIDGVGPNFTDAELQALFEANLNGSEGRLSIDPDSDRAVYGARINVMVHDETSLIVAIDKVIVDAARWNGDRLSELAAAVETSSAPVSDETFIRV